MCGEKKEKPAAHPSGVGSPPHVRGKETKVCIHDISDRITPAYAGKRCCQQLSYSVLRDHPRVCGEKLSWFRNVV